VVRDVLDLAQLSQRSLPAPAPPAVDLMQKKLDVCECQKQKMNDAEADPPKKPSRHFLALFAATQGHSPAEEDR
jgi:hypothetical protein